MIRPKLNRIMVNANETKNHARPQARGVAVRLILHTYNYPPQHRLEMSFRSKLALSNIKVS